MARRRILHYRTRMLYLAFTCLLYLKERSEVEYGIHTDCAVLNRLPACRGLIGYFLLTFSFSWLMFLPGLLTYYGVLNLSSQAVRWFAIAGLLGPTLSGFVMTAVIEGRPGVSRLLRRIVRWRVGLAWYLFALIGLPAVMVLATIVRPGALESLDISGQPFRVAYLQAFISMAVIGGPLFEEPGWTGFAQLRLQRRYGSLVGGVILGSLWALWHLPGFLIPSQDLRDIPPRGTVLDSRCSPSLSWVCG